MFTKRERPKYQHKQFHLSGLTIILTRKIKYLFVLAVIREALRWARTHLSLGEVQGNSNLVPPQPGQVVRMPELLLQLADLELGEGGSFLAGLRAQLLQLCSTKTNITTSRNMSVSSATKLPGKYRVRNWAGTPITLTEDFLSVTFLSPYRRIPGCYL